MTTQLEQAPDAADRLATAIRALDGSFTYDTEDAFTSGAYVTELRAEASRQGVTIIERDGRLSAFPLVLKLDAKTQGARVGRKMVRAIRPSALVKSLRDAQQAGRFNAAGFLEQLWRAYQHLVPPGWKPQDGSDGWRTLTVMAGLVPAICASSAGAKVAGTRPAMTDNAQSIR